LLIPIIRTLYLQQQRCEEPWLFYKATRGLSAKSLRNTAESMSFKKYGEIRLPPRCQMRSLLFWMLCSVELWLFSDVSGQRICPIFRG